MKSVLKINGEIVVLKGRDLHAEGYSQAGDQKCWKCKNGCLECSKVADRKKKDLADPEYDYITDGYQVFEDENCKNELKHFIVLNCDNYKKIAKTQEKRGNVKQVDAARRNLITYAYNTATAEEANKIRIYQKKMARQRKK